jgi:hypothetical protein
VKVRRKSHVLRVDLHATEAALLAVLFTDFAALLEDSDPDDPVVRRLYPDGYTDDSEASAEYRELVSGDLHEARAGRLQACWAELPEGGGRFELDDEAGERWIKVLNDLRLTLGTRLGVSEDDELDESQESVTVYHWLTAVQDMLVTHLMD